MAPKMLAALSAIVMLVCYPKSSLGGNVGAQSDLSLQYLQEHKVPAHPIQIRLPPSFNAEASKPWGAMAPNWFLGNWFITQSNQELYHIFRNFVWTLTRPCTDGDCYPLEATHLSDLTSFQLVNDTQRPNATYFAYSLDTAIGTDAYHSVPNGGLAAQNNTYEIISWGYDSQGAGFVVVFETPAASEKVASLDIFSRDPTGPSPDTLDAIKAGINHLGDQRLMDLLKGMTKTPQDGGRRNDPWPSCNATCRTNAYSVPL